MRIALLGARGLIGEHYRVWLQKHPWFSLTPVETLEQAAKFPLIFSALPNAVALEIEKKLQAAGCKVISSASAHRLDPGVPLLIPEVNPGAVALLQNKQGWIVTKPNCTVHTFVLPLTPLHRAFGLTHIHLTSMQALSGAGKKGLQDERLAKQVSVWIPEEEEKCRLEPLKIWEEPTLSIAAQCNRVPVLHGHVLSLSVRFKHRPTKEDILARWRSFSPLSLPSSPTPLIAYYEEDLPPLTSHGMQIECSRLSPCPHYDFRFIVRAHNAIRGGAGAGCLIAEYLMQEGFIA